MWLISIHCNLLQCVVIEFPDTVEYHLLLWKTIIQFPFPKQWLFSTQKSSLLIIFLKLLQAYHTNVAKARYYVFKRRRFLLLYKNIIKHSSLHKCHTLNIKTLFLTRIPCIKKIDPTLRRVSQFLLNSMLLTGMLNLSEFRTYFE